MNSATESAITEWLEAQCWSEKPLPHGLSVTEMDGSGYAFVEGTLDVSALAAIAAKAARVELLKAIGERGTISIGYDEDEDIGFMWDDHASPFGDGDDFNSLIAHVGLSS